MPQQKIMPLRCFKINIMEEENYYQKLFNYMHEEHGLILHESEMQDVLDICKEMLKKNLT